jgi:hypothetical protein
MSLPIVIDSPNLSLEYWPGREDEAISCCSLSISLSASSTCLTSSDSLFRIAGRSATNCGAMSVPLVDLAPLMMRYGRLSLGRLVGSAIDLKAASTSLADLNDTTRK